MNKYQKAWLSILVELEIHGLSTFDDMILIEELVKKETPIKPNHFKNGYRKCDNCGMKLLSTNGTPFKYCSYCGQRVGREKRSY